MGNASGREVENGHAAASPPEQLAPGGSGSSAEAVAPADVVMWEPPPLPPPAPYFFAPQVPVAPLQIPTEFPPVFGHSRVNGSDGSTNNNAREKRIPALITWRHGGNQVFVEGSWDNWTSRELLRRSGHVRAKLLVLPSGIYHYRIIVDGVPTYVSELPYVTDEEGQVANILDVNDNVPDCLDNMAEFDAPPSPEHSYGQQFPADDVFYKEPPALPPQLLMPVHGGTDSSDERAPKLKPKHVILDHLLIEQGWVAQSVLPLRITHRFQSKFVDFTLYKPLRRGHDMGGGSSGG